MRLPSVLDASHLPLAEQCAVRLDGDGFALGNGLIAADEPDGPCQRAASIAAAARHYDLVVGGWSAAWVHGATERLRRPLDLQTDRNGHARTKRVPVREVAFAPRDLVALGDVRVTSPFRTATDLARIEAAFPDETAAAVRFLVRAAGLSWPQAVAALATASTAPGKLRALARFRALRDAGSA